jgi:molecular chaperone GrpE
VAELEEKAAKDKDDYIRLMAEFDNYRRRTSQEKLELVSMASTDTIKGLLPVLDDCERAMKVLQESADSDAAKEGTELIYNKLMSYLKSKGLAVIEALGQPFDTDLHEAVAQFPVQEEEKKGKVFDVVQTDKGEAALDKPRARVIGKDLRHRPRIEAVQGHDLFAGLPVEINGYIGVLHV